MLDKIKKEKRKWSETGRGIEKNRKGEPEG
jgi:hypothetical protein